MVKRFSTTPAYDLLNTRLHVPNEFRTALPLFKGDFETESHRINGFYACDDFQELANRLGLHPGRFQRFMHTTVSKAPCSRWSIAQCLQSRAGNCTRTT